VTGKRFQIDAEWPAKPADGGRDVANLRIRVGDQVLTELAEVGADTLRDHLRTSAVTLALWFADNWWRLRWESLQDGRRPTADWRVRHEMTSAPGGTIWPPIMIYGAGARVVLAPVFGANVSLGPVRFLDLNIVHVLDGEAYESGLDAFLDAVVDVCARAQDGAALRALLTQLRDERADEEVAAWRSLEARLGYDPDEAPDALMERLSVLEDELGKRAVEEAATAAPGAESSAVLEEAVEASRASAIEADLSILTPVDPERLDPAVTPWRLGEEAAQAVRRRLGLTPGALPEDAYSDLLRTSWSAVKSASATARRLPYAARMRTPDAKTKIALQTIASVDRRFEMARVIGDEIWAMQDRFGVISRAKTERQKFQRAFAQSLLCPFSDLQRHVDLAGPSDLQIRSAARFFDVRPSVVQTLLVNKGVLPRETLEERLEAA
jgi:hypothetical protein